MDDDAVRAALVAAAAPFADGESAAGPGIDLVWAGLWGALVPGDAGTYAVAIEFVYEGYLLHYRESRVLPSGAPVDQRLLLGDHFDALGLRLVTEAGDIDSVLLLTRLMAACSWLRVAACPFDYDDDLWALTVAGMASVRQGGSVFAPLGVFDEIDRLIARERVVRLPAVVRRGAAGLWLRHPGPLRAALGLEARADDDSVDPVAAMRDADQVEPHEVEIVLAEEQNNDPGGVW